MMKIQHDNVAVLCAGNGQLHQFNMTEITNTLDCMHDQQIVLAREEGLKDIQLQMRLSVGDRPVDGELASGIVHGPGRVQRHVSRHDVYRGGYMRYTLCRDQRAKKTYRIHSEGGQSMPTKRYRVRRLTPTECARLQGFPDNWGHPDAKETMTQEETDFWNAVRRTRAAMDGKQSKDMTPEQAVKWYSKLRTDSSEYKMWGNAIAIPNAAYVLGRVAMALNGEPLDLYSQQ